MHLAAGALQPMVVTNTATAANSIAWQDALLIRHFELIIPIGVEEIGWDNDGPYGARDNHSP
jgi:hypothetical protein